MLCPPTSQPPGPFDLTAPHAFSWFYVLFMGAALALLVFTVLYTFAPFRFIPSIPGRRALLWLRLSKLPVFAGFFLIALGGTLWLSAIEAWQNLALAQGCSELPVTDAWLEAVKSWSAWMGSVGGIFVFYTLPFDLLFRRKARQMPGANIVHQEYRIIIKRPVETVFAAVAVRNKIKDG